MPEILVHVHLFYPEFWNEISACLKNISSPYDLVVTLVENDLKTIESIKGFKSDARIEIVENRGFDVAPFIKVMRENDLSRYDFVIHLHSKRDVADTLGNVVLKDAKQWRRLLLNFCSSPQNWQRTLKTFHDNPKTGMVADRVCILSERFDPTPEMLSAAKDYLTEHLKMPFKKAVFVSGTMFMARSELFKALVEKVSFDDFEPTKRQDFLTLGHIFERVFGYIVYSQNYEISDFAGRNWHVFPARLCPTPFLIRLKNSVFRFVFQKKTDKKGNTLIKVFKIPVWRKKSNVVK